MAKAYNVINKVVTDKYGDKKLKSYTEISAISSVVLLTFTAAKSTPFLRGVSTIAIGVTTALGAVDIVARTDNYMKNNVQADVEKGEGALDQLKDVIFNTSSKKKEATANG